jgi:hypothetical protein
MSLGDHFPDALKRASAVRSVAPGMVIKLMAVMDDGRVHEKRFLIVHVDENTVACVINSEIHPFIRNSPAILRCQVAIDPQAHPFMNWESHIDCSKVRQYPTETVVEELQNKPDWVLGNITTELRDQVVAAIKHSQQIAPIDVGIYTASLTAAKL